MFPSFGVFGHLNEYHRLEVVVRVKFRVTHSAEQRFEGDGIGIGSLEFGLAVLSNDFVGPHRIGECLEDWLNAAEIDAFRTSVCSFGMDGIRSRPQYGFAGSGCSRKSSRPISTMIRMVPGPKIG